MTPLDLARTLRARSGAFYAIVRARLNVARLTVNPEVALDMFLDAEELREKAREARALAARIEAQVAAARPRRVLVCDACGRHEMLLDEDDDQVGDWDVCAHCGGIPNVRLASDVAGGAALGVWPSGRLNAPADPEEARSGALTIGGVPLCPRPDNGGDDHEPDACGSLTRDVNAGDETRSAQQGTGGGRQTPAAETDVHPGDDLRERDREHAPGVREGRERERVLVEGDAEREPLAGDQQPGRAGEVRGGEGVLPRPHGGAGGSAGGTREPLIRAVVRRAIFLEQARAVLTDLALRAGKEVTP